MKALYQELRARLESETSAEHVRLWNNQMELLEKNEQIPFQFPAIFIDFLDINWRQLGKGTQIADLTVRFYVCFSSFHTTENEEDVTMFDLVQEVYLVLQDYKPSMGGKLTKTREETDTRHTNMYVWIMDYTTTYQDVVAQNPRNSTEAEITTLTLSTDLIIDPDTVEGIRTDFEFPE
jgi:hypothetical protein